MKEQSINELIDALKEASSVLEDISMNIDLKDLPNSFRYPLSDELLGFAFMLENGDYEK